LALTQIPVGEVLTEHTNRANCTESLWHMPHLMQGTQWKECTAKCHVSGELLQFKTLCYPTDAQIYNL